MIFIDHSALRFQVLSQLLGKLVGLEGLDDLPKAHILERLAVSSGLTTTANWCYHHG